MKTATQAQLDSVIEEYQALTGRLDAMVAQASAVTASAHSADRCVRVAVGPHGELTDVSIDAGLSQRLDSAALAARILEAARLAARQAREHMAATLSANLPPHLRHLIGPDATLDVRRVLPGSQLVRTWAAGR